MYIYITYIIFYTYIYKYILERDVFWKSTLYNMRDILKKLRDKKKLNSTRDIKILYSI